MKTNYFLVALLFAVGCGEGDATTESASESNTGTESSTTEEPSTSDSLTGTMSDSDSDPTAGTIGMSETGTTEEPTTEGPTTEEPTTEEPTTEEPTTEEPTTEEPTTGPSTTTSSDVCELTPSEEGTIPIVEACEGEEVMEVMDPWNFSVEWQHTLPGNGAITMPAIGSITDDNDDGLINNEDMPDIAITSWTGGTLVALHGDGSGTIFSIDGINGSAGATIADVDSDGEPEVLAFQPGRVIAVDNTGAIEWTSPALNGLSAYPQLTVADLDMDGEPEVIADVAILEGSTGALKSYMDATGPWRTPVVGDIDLDGKQEIILHSGVFASDGTSLWTIPGNGSASFAALANIDDDDFAEVFVNYGSTVYVHEHDGTMITSWPIPNNTN
ncbi:MAG: FG-GAP repeat domain-containing protein, partial [Nannocystaceae bacterium]